MPTKRSWLLLILALALYFLANQTQVGWVYIMTDLIVGLLLIAFFYGWGLLKSIQASRTLSSSTPAAPTDLTADLLSLQPPDFFEEQPVDINLTLTQTGLRPAFLVEGVEQCPFAPPTDRQQPFFVPSLFRKQPRRLPYQTVCYRRGLYTFPPLRLQSTGPFGLFKHQHRLAVPTRLLIFPTYHPLQRLRLLEQRGLTDRSALRVGVSNEVIGTREYRPGDSLRQIHWRSTARTGQLVVKEFADEEQLTLTVALDLSRPEQQARDKFSPFETAIRLAASLGYYATSQDIPFYLAGYRRAGPPPTIPLSWNGLLHYLAKVDNDGHKPLADVLLNLPGQPFLVVLVNQPSRALSRALLTLRRRGIHLLAMFITPDGTLPASAPAPEPDGLAVKAVSPTNWPAVLLES